MSNRSFEDAVKQCHAIVCDDSNTLWLADRLDDAVDRTKPESSVTKPRQLTPAEEAAIKLLQDAFENTGVPPRYYGEFVQMLRQGFQAPADRLIRQHAVKNHRSNRTPLARVSER